MMQDVDVVIVGAGAAGVGAGLALKELGLSFVILEAADRIGGRAFTDSNSMPAAWDQGCHWLHCADVNPLVAWADRLGSRYEKSNETGDVYLVWTPGGWADQAERIKTGNRTEAAFAAIYEAAAAGRDVPTTEAWPELDGRHPEARLIMQLLSSVDPETESTSGYADYDDTELNWPVVSGYGNLIERMAADLPIRKSVKVTDITEQPGGVQIETSQGTLGARAVIVTASNNVLLSGAIRFKSAEAQPVLDALSAAPCGSYEKICLALKRPLPELEGAIFASVLATDQPPLSLQILPHDDRMVICHVGGSVAKELSDGGERALTDFALGHMKNAFGSDITTDIAASATTGWQHNPLVLGAYSTVRPGKAEVRREAIKAHTGRIGFAGEAFSLKWQATAHGAYQSGRDVAARLAREELGIVGETL